MNTPLKTAESCWVWEEGQDKPSQLPPALLYRVFLQKKHFYANWNEKTNRPTCLCYNTCEEAQTALRQAQNS